MPEVLLSLGRIVLCVAAGYVVLAVGAHHLSLSMMFPRPPLTYAPGPDYLMLTAPDGVKIAARHWPNPRAKYTLLYLHGNYEDLGSIAEYVPQLVEAGYAVFAIDYRRYGLSGGIPDEVNLGADTRLAYDYLRKEMGIPAGRIVAYGYSLGSGPAVALALERPLAGLILQGAFISAYRVMTRVPLFPADKFENLREIPRVKCPVIVIHGSADQTVPFRHGERLYEAITAPKAKLFVEGGPHTGLADFAGPRFAAALQQFTDSL